MTTRRTLLAALFAAPAFATAPVCAQTPLPADKRAELNALIAKNNAYIGLFNRTQRANQSWERYTSWVNVERGPTGHERYITYGLYSLYDVRSEIQKALDVAGKEPKVPELDRAIERFVGAYEALAPLIDRAQRYYERKDYKSDAMVEGRELHAKLVPAAREFLKEDAEARQLMKLFAGRVFELELAAIEMEEGRKGRWQMKRVQMAARQAMDQLPTREKPVVDMPAFSKSVAEYGKVVREFDDYMRANPDSGGSMRDRPASLLGKLREYEEELQRARGDARRARGQGTTWIVNEYNMMISMSQMFR